MSYTFYAREKNKFVYNIKLDFGESSFNQIDWINNGMKSYKFSVGYWVLGNRATEIIFEVAKMSTIEFISVQIFWNNLLER